MSDPRFGRTRDAKPELKSVAGVSGVVHFNPNHDSDTGEFAPGPGGSGTSVASHPMIATGPAMHHLDRAMPSPYRANPPDDDDPMSLFKNESVGMYKGPMSSSINGSLRDGEAPDGTVRGIDRAMKGLPIDVTVYRGSSADEYDPIGARLIAKQPVVGGVLTDLGFTSTTMDRRLASEWAGGGRHIQYVIHVPKGTKGIWFGSDDSERELLLARGGRYQVAKVARQGRGFVVHLNRL